MSRVTVNTGVRALKTSYECKAAKTNQTKNGQDQHIKLL